MRMRIACMLVMIVALATIAPLPVRAQPGVEPVRPDTLSTLIAKLRADARARDSLSALMDSTQGSSRDFFEELVSQRDQSLHSGVLAVLEGIQAREAGGAKLTAIRQELSRAVREDWPRHLEQLKARAQGLVTMGRASDAAAGAERVAIEAEMSQEADGLLNSYRALVDVLLALEKSNFDVAAQRAFLTQGMPSTAAGMVTRLQLAGRARAAALARLSRDANNADLRYALEATDERLKRATLSLTTVIDLMDRLGLPTTDLRVERIAATGSLNADIFRWPVFAGLIRAQWTRLLSFVAGEAPHWLFQGMLILFTFLAFRTLAKLVRGAVRRAVHHWHASELMRRTITRMSGHVVMVIGFAVILTQLGVQVAPLLAGFGIAGVVIGFAMQSTLSNFAAGGMILTNQPFDIGDEIEVAGVSGVVKKMTLVSTTILTADNQTLIIPNSSVWGGVIRNRTAQPTRRVDLTFSISYRDDIDKAERVLQEIVARQPGILKEPVPVIRLHQLADSSVNFVVRVWTQQAAYWDVYWDVTRAVKLGFDREGITIPFPTRELHVAPGPGDGTATPAVPAATTRNS